MTAITRGAYMTRPKKPTKAELAVLCADLKQELVSAQQEIGQALKRLEAASVARNGWARSYTDIRLAYDRMARVHATPPEKILAIFSFTAEEVYMLATALGYLSDQLSKMPLFTHRNRSHSYLELAYRIDKEYMPLLDKINLAKAAQRKEREIGEEIRRKEPSGEIDRGPGQEDPGKTQVRDTPL
jgi:hypothetical protein